MSNWAEALEAQRMKWILCKRNGNVLENLDGSVRSLNPPAPYHWETRPAGTAGSYEQMTVNGGYATYNPKGDDPVVFGYVASVPNKPGCCAVTEQPLS